MRASLVFFENDKHFSNWLLDVLIANPAVQVRGIAAGTIGDFFIRDPLNADLLSEWKSLLCYFSKSLLALLPNAEEAPFLTAEYFRLLELLLQ